MSDLPAGAVTAAADVLHEAGCSDPSCHYAMHALANLQPDEHIATIALAAAAPHIAKAERERIIRLAQSQARAIRDRNRTITDADAAAAGTLEDFARLLARGAETDATAIPGRSVDDGKGPASEALQSDPRLLHVNGGVITIGTGDPAVEYQVDGWDDYACALRVSRLGLEDLAEDDGDPFHEPAVVAGGCDTAGGGSHA